MRTLWPSVRFFQATGFIGFSIGLINVVLGRAARVNNLEAINKLNDIQNSMENLTRFTEGVAEKKNNFNNTMLASLWAGGAAAVSTSLNQWVNFIQHKVQSCYQDTVLALTVSVVKINDITRLLEYTTDTLTKFKMLQHIDALKAQQEPYIKYIIDNLSSLDNKLLIVKRITDEISNTNKFIGRNLLGVRYNSNLILSTMKN